MYRSPLAALKMKRIYLDHNATTPIDPEVRAAIQECYHAGYVNPSSPHASGRQSRRVLENARERIGELLGLRSNAPRADRLVFTSGGTEANNLAIFGIGHNCNATLFVSSVEHPSILAAAQELENQGVPVVRLPVNADGVVSLDRLESLLTPTTRLVSVMGGNNETGVLQPLAEVVSCCESRNIALHSDVVQVAGKLPLNFRELGLAAMSVSAHKFGGPVGIGALVLRHDLNLKPLLFGGFQQAAFRPGTEPIAAIVGMCRALELSHAALACNAARMSQLRDQFEAVLASELPQIEVHGSSAERLPHTSNIAFPGLDRQALLMALDLAGIDCSTGSACASGSSESSHVLLAMGCAQPLVNSSLRFSLGRQTTRDEIEWATREIIRISRGLWSQSGSFKSATGPR